MPEFLYSNINKIKGIFKLYPSPAFLSGLNDIFHIDTFYAMRQHILPGMLQGTLQVNALGGIGNHIGFKAQFAGIDCSPGHTKVRGNPDHKYGINPAFTQIASKTRRGFLVSFHKGRITVDLGMKTLANDELCLR